MPDKKEDEPTGTLPPSTIDIGSLLRKLHGDAVLAPYVAALPKGPEHVRCRSKCDTSSLRSRRKPACKATCWMDYGGRSDPEQYDWEYEEGEPTHYRFRALEGRYWMKAKGDPAFVAERIRQAQTLPLEDLEEIYDREAEEREALEEKRQEQAMKLMEAARAEKEKMRKAREALAAAEAAEKAPVAGPSIQKAQFSPTQPNKVSYTITLTNPFARPPKSDPMANTAELYSVADSVEYPLAAIHKHLVRIYSPALPHLYQAPSMWKADGQGWKLLTQVKESTLNGSQFELGGRMLGNVGTLARRILERHGLVSPKDPPTPSAA